MRSIVWRAHGTLSPARDNVVLYPTSYGAQHPDLEWLIGPDGVLDPTRWFIVIPNMFGNGLSSSPSNTAPWPALVTAHDNVAAQRRLLAEVFGVERLHAVYGWSMGAQQAYHWAAAYPDAVERAVINCGSARTSMHNRVFLRGHDGGAGSGAGIRRHGAVLGASRARRCAPSGGSMPAGR